MPTAAIAASSSGDNTVLAAHPGGMRWRVLAYTLSSAGSVNAKWKSGANDISGLLTMASGTNVSPSGGGNSFDPLPLLVTNPGEALVLNLSGSVGVGGHLTYDAG